MSARSYRGRVVLLGDSSVGKTSIILRYIEGTSPKEDSRGKVLDKQIKTVEVGEDKLQLHILDTAGQERYDSLSLSYCRNAGAVILVYDCTRLESFQNVDLWAYRMGINDHDGGVVLVGNKSDLQDEAVVTPSMAKTKAEGLRSEGVDFFETSAKEGTNIEALFQHVASLIISKKHSRSSVFTGSPKPLPCVNSRSRSRCCF